MEKRKTEEKRKDGKEDVTEIASFLNFQGRAEMHWVSVLSVCVCVGGELRTCVYIWAFVQEPQYQTRRVTDNPTQGMHYD